MVDCGKCVKLGTYVLQAPSEVEGGSPSEVMACVPSEEMRGVFQGPVDFAVEG